MIKCFALKIVTVGFVKRKKIENVKLGTADAGRKTSASDHLSKSGDLNTYRNVLHNPTRAFVS